MTATEHLIKTIQQDAMTNEDVVRELRCHRFDESNPTDTILVIDMLKMYRHDIYNECAPAILPTVSG